MVGQGVANDKVSGTAGNTKCHQDPELKIKHRTGLFTAGILPAAIQYESIGKSKAILCGYQQFLPAAQGRTGTYCTAHQKIPGWINPGTELSCAIPED